MENRKITLLNINKNSLYVVFFVFVILVIPVNVKNYRLFNEPIMLLAFLGSIIYIISNKKISKKEYVVLAISAIFSFLFLLILFINLPDEYTIKDFVEPLKPIIYGLIFVVGAILSKKYKESDFIKLFLLFSVFSVLFSSLVFFKPMVFLVDMYKGRRSFEPLHFYRFSGTLAYPGPFSYWLVFALQTVLFAYQKKYLNRWLFYPLYIFLLWGFIMTGSRGGIIVFLFTNIIYFAYNLKKKKVYFIYLSLMFLALLFGLFLRDRMFEGAAFKYIVSGFDNPLESSFLHRVKELNYVYNSFTNGRLFGYGPNNKTIEELIKSVETVYFYYGYKFGIIGLAYYGCIVGYALYFLGKNIKKNPNSLGVVFFIWSFVCLTLGALNESITEEYKSFYIFFLLYGIFTSVLYPSIHLYDIPQEKVGREDGGAGYRCSGSGDDARYRLDRAGGSGMESPC